MRSTITRNGSSITVTLEGDLTGGGPALEFAKELKEQIASSTGVTAVYLDLAQVGFVDSAGLGMLLGAREAAITKGAALHLQNINSQLAQLLEITKLAEILGVTK